MLPQTNPHARAFPLTMPLDANHGLRAAWVIIDIPAELSYPATIPLPRMCPRSGNPGPGSTLSLRPITPTGQIAEIGAVAGEATAAAALLVGGHGNVRDMEGAVAFIARAVAKLLHCPVAYRADLKITTPPPSRVACTLVLEGQVLPYEREAATPAA